MSNPRSVGRLAFSILLESERKDPPASTSASGLTGRLLSVFAQHNVRATWALRQPWQSSVASKILARESGHELALLGDPDWAGGRGKARLPMELSRRLGMAREEGRSIASILLPGVGSAGLHANGDALAAADVRVVCSPKSPDSHAATRPVAIRDGLWHVPATSEITPLQGWLAAARRRGWWHHALQQASTSDRVTHFWFDAASLQHSAGVHSLDSALRAAVAIRAKRGLRIATLAEIADMLDATPRAARSHSILRAA